MAIGTRILGLGGGLAVLLGCATTDARFADGQRALASGAWQRASEAFAGFAADNCHAGYHFTVQEDHGFSLSPGASGELHVRVFEKSPEATPRDALDATFGEQGSGLSPKAIAE